MCSSVVNDTHTLTNAKQCSAFLIWPRCDSAFIKTNSDLYVDVELVCVTAPAVQNPGSKPPLMGGEVTESSMEVVLRNPFNEDNGEIKYYSVIITSDIEEEIKDPPPKWSDVQKGENKGYAAIHKCASLFSSGDGCWEEEERTKRQVSDVSRVWRTLHYFNLTCFACIILYF